MKKGKSKSKSKKVSKSKVRLPKKVEKGQITKKELKSVGFVARDNELRSDAPVESISGIGSVKGAGLRKEGIKTVGDYRSNFADYFNNIKK